MAFDVAEGYVSREIAEAEYGVILDARGKVDAEATRARRATMAKAS